MAGPIGIASSIAAGVSVNAGMELLGGISRGASMAGNRIVPNNSIPIDAYHRLYMMRLMGSDNYSAHLRELGFLASNVDSQGMKLLLADSNDILFVNQQPLSGDVYWLDKFLATSKNLPSPDELLLMFNRGLISEQATKWLLKLNYGGETELARKYFTLKDQIPGPSDLVSFAVRDCFSPDIVKTFEYNKELPTAILPWMIKQGLGGDVGIALPDGSTTTEGPDNRPTAKWFDMYWWSHWQLPSVGQGYEMLQRLYSQSAHGASPYADDTTYFDVSSLELLQKANDYPPFWRKRLQAIAYHPLGRIDIKRLYASGILKENQNTHDVFHAYRANGYNDTDAQRLTDYVVKKARPDIVHLTVQQINRLYKQGSLADINAIEALQNLDFTQAEATYHVQNLKLEITADTVDFKLKYVRAAFLAGDISQDDVVSYFTGMHLQQDAQELYLSRWRLQLEVTYRHVSVNKAIELLKKGYITSEQLRNKLVNLRYSVEEQELLITEAEDDITIAQANKAAKLTAALLKQQQGAQKQAAKVADAKTKAALKLEASLAKEHAKLVANDQKAFTDKNVIAFWKAGLLTPQQIVNIQLAKGWLPDTVSVWMQTWTPYNNDGTPNVTKKATPTKPVPPLTISGPG